MYCCKVPCACVLLPRLCSGTAASSSYNEFAFIQTQASSIVFRCVVYPEPVLAQWPFCFSKTSVVSSTTTDDFELKDAQAAKDELDKHNTNAQSTQQDHDETPARMRYARYVRATLNRADKRHHGTTNAAVTKQKRSCLLFIFDILTGRPEVVLANNCPDVRLKPGVSFFVAAVRCFHCQGREWSCGSRPTTTSTSIYQAVRGKAPSLRRKTRIGATWRRHRCGGSLDV